MTGKVQWEFCDWRDLRRPFEQRFEQRAREDLIRTSQRRAVDQTKICSENLRELARDQAR